MAFVKANCPDLVPLTDASFGATTNKLIEVAGIYHRCRAAIFLPVPTGGPDDKQGAKQR